MKGLNKMAEGYYAGDMYVLPQQPKRNFLENMQILSESENPTDPILYRKGSGRVMSQPNPYYTQIQQLRNILPAIQQYLRNKQNPYSGMMIGF